MTEKTMTDPETCGRCGRPRARAHTNRPKTECGAEYIGYEPPHLHAVFECHVAEAARFRAAFEVLAAAVGNEIRLFDGDYASRLTNGWAIYRTKNDGGGADTTKTLHANGSWNHGSLSVPQFTELTDALAAYAKVHKEAR